MVGFTTYFTIIPSVPSLDTLLKSSTKYSKIAHFIDFLTQNNVIYIEQCPCMCGVQIN